jgi:hypothetical protein
MLKKDNTSKLIANDIREIKAPIEIASLHNLKELADQEKIYRDLETNLDKYKMNYYKSFIKSQEEILKAIPVRHHSKYHDNLTEFLDKAFDLRGSNGGGTKGFIIDTKNQQLIGVMRNPDKITFKFNEDYSTLTVRTSKIHRVWHNYDRPDGEDVSEYVFEANKNTFKSSKQWFDKYNKR